mmetsp:Transcript_19389/g.28277  ORF Transcript_19389/g.28277 Transcript_19389/m.28277 type:complete len:232 (+) Transcript_19389:127-822(+)|eukprot:CAMPEP_0197246972 /NCGR_PEP_ID=MMETSP1429-20130617/24736_1 /TAXON_ID=49237 /ORGANISM="Chaetoceros  sp., Strain UNC1202" /LENGTH=231 /DNA_ID=CAMNT_0042707769 /DNA_START=96 /DNA_END=791 /DNA_ORIENTATION=+
MVERMESRARAIMELLGTLILVFTIQASGSPMAIGAVLIAIVFAGGPISGAHYNPAVSAAIALRGNGHMKSSMGTYWLCQIIGGVLGAMLGGFVTSSYSTVAVGVGHTVAQALVGELIITFLLCFVVLCVATNSKAENNHYYGLAIGLVVAAGAVSVGPVSGGAFNPAVAFGLCAAKSFENVGYALSVVVVNLLGGIAAYGAFVLVAPHEFCDIEFDGAATTGEATPLTSP